MENCLFCQIGAKVIDSVVLWEDEDILVFLDIRPIREGHCQIIPKKHFETFETLPPELAGKIINVGQKIAKHLKKVYEVERVAFIFTGNDIPHTHAHVLPMQERTDVTSARFIMNFDSVEFVSDHLKASTEDLLKVKSRLKLEI